VVNIASASGIHRLPAARPLVPVRDEQGQILGWRAPACAVSVREFCGGDLTRASHCGPRLQATSVRATDFHNGRVDVWEGSGNLVTVRRRSATIDSRRLCAFGIQRIRRRDLRHDAKQDADAVRRRARQGSVSSTVRNGRQSAGPSRAARQLNASVGASPWLPRLRSVCQRLLVGANRRREINDYAMQPTGNFEHSGASAEPTGSRSQ